MYRRAASMPVALPWVRAVVRASMAQAVGSFGALATAACASK